MFHDKELLKSAIIYLKVNIRYEFINARIISVCQVFEFQYKINLSKRLLKVNSEIKKLRAENVAHEMLDAKISQLKEILKSEESAGLIKMRYEDALEEISQKLSPRQFEIFNMCIKGKTSNEIGEAMFIARTTVDFQIKEICQKLNVHKRSQFGDLILKKMGLGLLNEEVKNVLSCFLYLSRACCKLPFGWPKQVL